MKIRSFENSQKIDLPIFKLNFHNEKLMMPWLKKIASICPEFRHQLIKLIYPKQFTRLKVTERKT